MRGWSEGEMGRWGDGGTEGLRDGKMDKRESG